MEWNDLIPKLKSNISYWAYRVSSVTVLENDDAYQELLLLLWKQYCLNMTLGNDVTVYFMQKRLQYGAYNMIRKSVKTQMLFEKSYLETQYYDSEQRKLFYSNYVNEVFDDLKTQLINNNDLKTLDILVMLLEGKSNTQIGEIMGMKSSTLSQYITRTIKKQLKKIIKEYQKNNIYINCEIV